MTDFGSFNPDPADSSSFRPTEQAPPTLGPLAHTKPDTSEHGVHGPIDDKIIAARQAGYSWTEINDAIFEKRQKASAAGYSEEEIDEALGFQQGISIEKQMLAQAKRNLSDHTKADLATLFNGTRLESIKGEESGGIPAPPPHPDTIAPDDWLGALVNGLKASSGNLAIGGKPDERVLAEHPGLVGHFLNLLGEELGDLPLQIAGGVGGGIIGSAGAPGVGTAAGMAGAFMLPAYIKQQYVDGLKNGSFQGPSDFAARQAYVWMKTAQQGVLGASTAVTGGIAATGARAFGLGAAGRFGAVSAAELSTMVTAGAAIEGRLPTKEDFIDGAVTLIGFKAATATPRFTKQVVNRLYDHFAVTNETPVEAARRAFHDPVFRATLTSGPPEAPKAAPGDSTTPTPDGDEYVVNKPVPGETSREMDVRHTEVFHYAPFDIQGVVSHPDVADAINHAPVNRDHSVPYLSGPSEDGKTLYVDRHIPERVKIGDKWVDPSIPYKIHEFVERFVMNEAIKNGMTPEEAYEFAHHNYAEVAEDHWIKHHGIDLEEWNKWNEAMEDHIQHEEALDPPKDLFKKPYPHGQIGEAKTTPIDTKETVEGGAPEQPDINEKVLNASRLEPLTTPPRGTMGGNVGDISSVPTHAPVGTAPLFAGTVDEAQADILSHMMGPKTGPDLVNWLQDAWFHFYRQIFRPDHAINLLTDAVQRGKPLNDARNPNYMARIAELAHNLGRYMISRKMIDVNGDVTGPGLMEIINQFKTPQEHKNFQAYAIAKWAVEKADQLKETGVDIDAARMVVDKYEMGGKQVAPHDVMQAAADHGIAIFNVDPSHPLFAPNGPHYMPRISPTDPMYQLTTNLQAGGHYVMMGDPAKYDYEAQYGRGVTYETVLAHEVAHGIAHDWMIGKGRFARLTPVQEAALRDELTIHSRRFKPGLWQDLGATKGGQAHYRKDQELIADAIATWMTEPGARRRMPILDDLLGSRLAKEFGPAHFDLGTKYSRAFEDLMDWQNGTLKYMHDAGLVSHEAYLAMVADNVARIPGYRHDPTAKPGLQSAGEGQGFTYSSVKEFYGSDKNIKHVYESLMQDAFLRAELANRAIQNKTIADAAESVGQGGYTQKKTVAFKLSLDELDKIRGPQTGMGPSGVDTIFRKLSQGLQDDEIPVFTDGKMRPFKPEDPALTEFLRNQDPATMSIWQRGVAWLTKIQRASIVLNPAFPVHLAAYDVPWQFIIKPGFRNTIQQLYLGLGHIWGNTVEYDQFLRSGGAEKIIDGLSKNAFMRETLRGTEDKTFTNGVWNVMRSPYDALRWWGNRVTAAQRVGRFVQAKQEGASTIEAGVQASEAAFHRAGFGGNYTKNLNRLHPFFAAYLNSLEQTTRAMFGIGKTITGEKFSAIQTAIKGMTVITMPMIANWWFNKDEEWYKAAPDWQKDNGLLLPIPGTGGEGKDPVIFFFKFPPLVSLVFGGIPRRLFQAHYDDNPEAFTKGLAGSIFGSVAPPSFLLYNLALPVAEHIANWSFFKGRPLASENQKDNLLPPEQSQRYSSETAKGISRFVSDYALGNSAPSPVIVDHYIDGYAGPMARMMIQAAEQGLQAAGLAKVDAPTPHFPQDLPIFSSFFERVRGASSVPIQDFHDRMINFQREHGSLVYAMEHGDMARFQQILSQNPTATQMHGIQLRGAGGAMAAGQPEFDNFSEALDNAKGGADMQAAEAVLKAKKAVETLTQYAKAVWAHESPETRDYMSAVEGGDFGSGLKPTDLKKGQLTGDDKRQILDQTYAWMQTISERALKEMDRAGMK